MAESASTAELEHLLEHLRDRRSFDFTGYKRSTLARRIAKRMEALGIDSYEDYQDHLEVDPGEFTQLFNTILINVTRFFREPEMWKYLEDEVIPHILGGKNDRDPLRVWSAGCASGQEAYSAAMILAEHLGEEEFRRRVKIYGTDVDEEALAEARLARYDEKQLGDIPDHLRQKYFTEGNGGPVFRPDIRHQVIFGRHDLVQDAPISRIDLLLCRNALMYFNAETQGRILNGFHFALAPEGFLVLGKSEMLLSRSNSFAPFEMKHRVFRPVDGPRPRFRAGAFGIPGQAGAGTSEEQGPRLEVAAFELAPVASLVFSADGLLTAANREARSLFGLGPSSLGRTVQQLSLADGTLTLHPVVDRVYMEGTPSRVEGFQWTRRDGELRVFDIDVVPVDGDATKRAGVVALFTEITHHALLERRLEESRRDLETAYEELQSTVEELETTNEELQSTNEELETTNEELQSTNEELETMNEELESTNEELETANTELAGRSEELDRTNDFLHSIVHNHPSGLAVLDRELRVRTWNRGAEDLWGLRDDEISGVHFLNLDIGLPVDDLAPAMRRVLGNEDAIEVMELDAHDRRGKPIRCEVTVASLGGHDDSWVMVIMRSREEDPSAAHG